MPSNSETGHAKNVANFKDLITHVKSLGAAYKPSKEGLLIANLEAQHTAAAASLLSLAKEMPVYQQAVDAKQAAFAPLNKLVTRALNMFKASVDNHQEVESASSLANKIRGVSKAKPVAPEGEEPVKTISTSQQSDDMLIANFRAFIEILAAHAAYEPNEADLKIASLKTLLASLEERTAAVTQAQININIARNNRNSIIYTEGTGLVDTGASVKTYVKAAFTPEVANYKPIMSLEFRNPKK
jgi:hypothetical protein